MHVQRAFSSIESIEKYKDFSSNTVLGSDSCNGNNFAIDIVPPKNFLLSSATSLVTFHNKVSDILLCLDRLECVR